MNYYTQIANLISDKDDVLTLLKRNFNNFDEMRFNWLYGNSNDNNSGCILLKTKAGDVVGMNGYIIRKLSINGKLGLIAHAIDLLVDKKHRTVGPALQLQKALINHMETIGVYLIYGIPLRPAQLVLRRVGYKALAKRQRWVKPLRSFNFISNRTPLIVKKTFSPLVDIFFQIKSGEFLFKPHKNYIVTQHENYDMNFSSLWEENSAQFNVVTERSQQYLNWRFKQFPHTEFSIFKISNNYLNTQSYIIYRIDNRTAFIDDLFTNDLRSFKYLLLSFSKFIRKKGLDTIMHFYAGSTDISAIFKSCGFFSRHEDSQVFIFISKQIKNKDIFENIENWLITDADKDI